MDKRNGRRADLSVVVGDRLDAPDGLSEPALALWQAYWADPVATVQTGVDRGLLYRWIGEYDRYLRMTGEADQEPLVTGSQGQSVENPLYKIAYRALAAAEKCERQLGVGPLWRSNLGIAVIAEKKSLADMNAKYGGGADGHGGQDAPARPDPRIIEAQAT